MGLGTKERQMIARRAAQEIKPGMIVNLGIGIPTMVSNFVSPDLNVVFHGENGVLGYGGTPETGAEDENMCNAGGLPVNVSQGASFFDSTVAFGIIRSSRLDITVLGALQVSVRGDIASWVVPGRRVPGMGGAMELTQKTRRVIIVMEHLDKAGNSKIMTECTFPLTARRCVDLIITDKAVIEVTGGKLLLREVACGTTIEEVLRLTDAPLELHDAIDYFS
ncbi:3-oxoacid CoA-transferase subunit B [Alicyclobacillus sp. SO9]|uniref:3-oxoacid CoA-transferase subunit B n=1 Tax=Alicyclobacillus sp. SO9 TaxID=2665646 RepID=UPI0018E81593|nr:3-oxoacid CoA-transferase subunit B [Alicyclobacillus sp. SO9]QQE79773.1 3-oxoacid CoA-transferase subunit B [Alicyclobacillus sp. SO9]